MASSDSGNQASPMKTSQDNNGNESLEDLISKWKREKDYTYQKLADCRTGVDEMVQSLEKQPSGITKQIRKRFFRQESSDAKALEYEFVVKPANKNRRIENQIKEYIEQDIDKKKFKIKIDFNWDNWEQRKPNVPLVVFCNYSSRIGSDVEYALRDVDDPQVILVVLHLCRKALIGGQNLYDTDYLLSDDLKGRVAFIAHFAFDDVVYDCHQNQQARWHICKELSQK